MSAQFNRQIYFYFKLFNLVKQFHFKQFSPAQVRSLNIKSVLFQTIQFSISTQFSSVLPLWAKVYLRAIAMKGISTFPKAPALLEHSLGRS